MVTLDANHTLEAIFVLDIPLLLSIVMLLVAIAVVSVVILLRRRRIKLQRRVDKR